MDTENKTNEEEIAKLKEEVKFLKSAVFVFSFIVGGLIVGLIELALR